VPATADPVTVDGYGAGLPVDVVPGTVVPVIGLGTVLALGGGRKVSTLLDEAQPTAVNGSSSVTTSRRVMTLGRYSRSAGSRERSGAPMAAS
jgi:hypothetical protein